MPKQNKLQMTLQNALCIVDIESDCRTTRLYRGHVRSTGTTSIIRVAFCFLVSCGMLSGCQSITQ